MFMSRTITILATVVLMGAGLAWAQSSTSPTLVERSTPVMAKSTTEDCPWADESSSMAQHDQAMAARHEAMTQAMEARSAKLDSLVATMNEAEGPEKVDAMASVVEKLVTERTAMHEAMASMGPEMAKPATRHMPMDGSQHMDGLMHRGGGHHPER